MASRYMFWLIAKPSARLLQKFTRKLALMHWDYQSQTKLFWITTDNYYTSVPLAMELKSRKLTLVGMMKKKKAAFHPVSWRKQMKEQFNTHLTMQTVSLCCPLLQRKTRGSSSCPLCIPKKKTNEDTGKEEINAFYNQEKGGVDSHDQMCSLYTTARKTNHWPMRLFYGMIDSAALFLLKMCPTLENIRKTSDKNS